MNSIIDCSSFIYIYIYGELLCSHLCIYLSILFINVAVKAYVKLEKALKDALIAYLFHCTDS